MALFVLVAVPDDLVRQSAARIRVPAGAHARGVVGGRMVRVWALLRRAIPHTARAIAEAPAARRHRRWPLPGRTVARAAVADRRGPSSRRRRGVDWRGCD